MSYIPSGQQFEISAGEHRATIVEVGGGIRSYRVSDRDVLQPYPVEAICDGAHGTPLIPWPNRLGDGRYRFQDKDYQVALTEPDKHNAIHGFLRWRAWQPVHHSTDQITMSCTLFAVPGYPFTLSVQINYRLEPATGLTVTTSATNISDTPCPYGCGQHPYLSPGHGRLDDCTLHLDAQTRIRTDPERQLPTGTEPVSGTRYDFRSPQPMGDLQIDDAFTDLHRDPDQRAWVHLTGPDHGTAHLWVDHTYPIIEIYTGDTLAPARRRTGLGTEPMTCPPNAFQTGDHLIELAPGKTTTSTWGANLT